MNKEESAFYNINIFEVFPNRVTVLKDDLRDLFRLNNPNFNEQSFRRFLYHIERENIIIPLGAGVYGIPNPSQLPKRKKYNPILSSTAHNLILILREYFPYTQYMLWETKYLHEFMIHQPGNNHIVLEIEKDSSESVFNRLNEQLSLKTFLNPDKQTFERYILNAPENILLLRLISQSPRLISDDIVFARLEKILVDIYSDEYRFFSFHGQEMTNIFENAFSNYWINLKTLFRYAGRRKAETIVRKFIKTKTTIDLSSYLGIIE